MERLRRKPCCLESTQGSSKASQQKRVALAISLLSVLTMLSGLVLFGVYMGVPWLVVWWDFLGRQTMVLRLYWCEYSSAVSQ